MTKAPVRRLERRIFAPGSATRLAAVRIGLSAIVLWRLCRPAYLRAAAVPKGLYWPISFMHLISSMPPRPVVATMQAIGILASALAVLGWRSRVTVPLAWGCAVFLNGMLTSLGMVVHNDVMVFLAMVPLLAAPTGDAWSLDSRRAGSTGSRPEPVSVRYGWPVHTAMVVVAGSYFFTGFAKLMFSGPAWVTSGNLRWILYTASDAQRYPNHLGLFIADRPWLAHVMALAVMVLELGFPVVLWRPALLWVFLPGVAAMHAGIWLTMHLNYFPWAATAIVVFVDWPGVVDRVREPARSLPGRAQARAAPDPPA